MRWITKEQPSMDLQLMLFMLILYFVDLTLESHTEDMWDELSLKYGVFKELPTTRHKAEKDGYKRSNDICKKENFHGFLYINDPDDTKALPIYDLNGYIAGLQARIPGRMFGYNWRNETILLPPEEIRPPLFEVQSHGITMYAITVYFKHPHLVCNPIPKQNIQTGKGLYIQNGENPETDFIQIPMESKDLSPIWKPGSCVPQMGLHYFMNLTKWLPCEKIYPVFLMYDIEGKLSAFGWSFQGKPMDLSPLKWFTLKPDTYPFAFDTRKLPACMFTPNFSVFGLHIWLRSPYTDLMSCKVGTVPIPKVTRAPQRKVTYRQNQNNNENSNNGYSQVITVKPNSRHINSSNRLCLINSFLFLFIFISRTLQWFVLGH